MNPEQPREEAPGSYVRRRHFEERFSGSKVVDENGNPLRVYHGTTKDFDEFSVEGIERGLGAWFTSDPKTASTYASGEGGNSSVDELKKLPEIYQLPEEQRSAAIKQILEQRGYDGIKSWNYYAVFSPEQIISAFDSDAITEN